MNPAVLLRPDGPWWKWFIHLCLGVSIVIVLLVLSGCGDAAHWYSRTFYDTDCRPEKLQNGYCVSAKKGNANAQTTPP